MDQVDFSKIERLSDMRKVYRFLGYRQGRKRKGQEDCLSLPCRIAAQWRSSRSSALLYPQPGKSIVSLFFGISGLKFVIKMGSISILILILHLTKWVHFRF
jgi:hypothetical protein